MITFLIYLIIAIVLLGLLFWLLNYLPVPQPFNNVIRILLILVLILWILFYLMPHGRLALPT